MSLGSLLLGATLCQLAAMAFSRTPKIWRLVTLAGTALTLAAAIAGLLRGTPWDWHGGFTLGGEPLHFLLDGLSAFFLALLALIGGAGAVYAGEYWADSAHPRSARVGRFWWSILLLSLGVVLVSSHGLQFLFGWELFTVAAYFLITLDRQPREVRSAGWLYLNASHVGTVCLFAFFAALAAATGSWELGPMTGRPELAPLFWLALVGFGLKSGMFPLHVWLPSAHANAPSHVSAILSGVMLKMGVYGLVRICSLISQFPAWWGWLLVSLGGASAIVAIAFAAAQHDYKRLLAYSSIENIGVITLGLGASMVGRAVGDDALATLALAGALLHVWNHALFKPLLFFVAGSVLHATGTRRIDLLGGLAKTMPRTAALAGLGCIAICALPPLNGFAGEWLIYKGLLGTPVGGRTLVDAGRAASVIALALTGGLATVAFVRFFAAVFLGAPRTELAQQAHESPLPMLVPAAIAAMLCVAIGLLAAAIVPLLGHALRIAGGPAADRALRSGVLAPLTPIGVISAGLLVAGAGAALGFNRWKVARGAPRTVTWDCGYARPSARMQYGESSLGQMIAALFSWILAPRRRGTPLRGLFPVEASFQTETPDAVLDRGVQPGLQGLAWLVMRLRLLQRGKVQVYMLYIFLVVLVLLVLV